MGCKSGAATAPPHPALVMTPEQTISCTRALELFQFMPLDLKQNEGEKNRWVST